MMAAQTKTTPKKAVVKAKPVQAVAKIPGELSLDDHIKLAISKGMIETVERLLAIRRELKAEWARERFFKALSLFQKNCPIIVKSAAVNFESKKGGRVKYNYAPLDVIVAEVKDSLEEYGFSYTITTQQDDHSVTAICNLHHTDGYSESTSFAIPIDQEAFMNAAQKVASALTYAKRYAFCNALGIMTGDIDDDARSLNGNGQQQESPKEKKQDKPTSQGLEVIKDECFTILDSGAFKSEAQVKALLAKTEELFKEKNEAALTALRDSIKRQQAAYAKAQEG